MLFGFFLGLAVGGLALVVAARARYTALQALQAARGAQVAAEASEAWTRRLYAQLSPLRAAAAKYEDKGIPVDIVIRPRTWS